MMPAETEERRGEIKGITSILVMYSYKATLFLSSDPLLLHPLHPFIIPLPSLKARQGACLTAGSKIFANFQSRGLQRQMKVTGPLTLLCVCVSLCVFVCVCLGGGGQGCDTVSVCV